RRKSPPHRKSISIRRRRNSLMTDGVMKASCCGGGSAPPRPALRGERVGVRGSLHEHDPWREPLTRIASVMQSDLSPQAGLGEAAATALRAIKGVLLALFLCWAQPALADVAVPQLVGRVVDQTGTLNASFIDTLNQRIRSFEQRKGSQIAILIVPTTQPETIEQYSIRVAEAWKIGRKKIDDGAILVIAKNDHKLRIEVGYG